MPVFLFMRISLYNICSYSGVVLMRDDLIKEEHNSSIERDLPGSIFLLASREKSTKAMYIWALVTVECWPWTEK